MSRDARLLAMPWFAVLFPRFFLLSTINKIFLPAIVVRVRECSFFASFISFSSSSCQIKSFEIEIIYWWGARSLPISSLILHLLRGFSFQHCQFSLSTSIYMSVCLFVCNVYACMICVFLDAVFDMFGWFAFFSYIFIFLFVFWEALLRFRGYDGITPKWSSFTSWLKQRTANIVYHYYYMNMLLCAKKIYLFSHRVSNNAMA